MQYSEMGSKKELSILEVYRFSFYALLEKFPFFLMLILVYGLSILGFTLVVGALGFLPFAKKFLAIAQILKESGFDRTDIAANLLKTARPEVWIVTALVFLAIFAFYRYLALGFTHIALKIYDNKKPELSDLFACYHLILTDTIATLLFIFIVIVGSFFLIIPGIYFAIALPFYHQAIVYRDAGIIESLQESFRLVRGHWWEIFAILFIYGCIAYAARAIFGLLALAISPLAPLVYAYVYRVLGEIKNFEQRG